MQDVLRTKVRKAVARGAEERDQASREVANFGQDLSVGEPLILGTGWDGLRGRIVPGEPCADTVTGAPSQ